MISTQLHRYIAKGAAMDFGPTIPDCCMWPANWCVECGNDDPGKRWRGKYTEAEALELVAHYTLLDLWTLGMIDAGIPEVDEAQIGDVAVVECVTDDGVNQCGAIFGGKRFHALSPKGVFQAHMRPLRIWRVVNPLHEACHGG